MSRNAVERRNERKQNMCGTSRTRGGALVLSLLLASSLQLRCGHSFLLPSTAAQGFHHASRSASCAKTVGWASAPEGTGSDEGAQQHTAEEGAVEAQDDGHARSPAGLTLEGVYKRLKLETQGLADGVVGLESKDTDYGVSLIALQTTAR